MIRTALVSTLLGAVLAAPAVAAELETPALSPRAEVMQTVGVTEIHVSYSSPGKRDRTIWGELVPYGELWRTGANRATTLETEHDLTVGGEEVPAGRYAVFTIPGEDEWTVILNTNPDQGGTGSYDEELDQARFTVTPTEGAPRERLTFVFSDTTANSTHLDLVWDGVQVRLPIEVDTDGIVSAAITDYTSSAAGDLTDAARHLQRTGDAEGALQLVDAAIAVDRSWFNVWIKATILHDLEEHKDAKKAAKEALALGNDAENFFWKDRVEAALAEWPRR